MTTLKDRPNTALLVIDMLDNHYIEWIEIETADKVYRKELKPGDKPEAEFLVTEEIIQAREYCSLHEPLARVLRESTGQIDDILGVRIRFEPEPLCGTLLDNLPGGAEDAPLPALAYFVRSGMHGGRSIRA